MSGGLLQIRDPLKTQGRAVGIDLGTTNSLVAHVRADGKPECLRVDEGGSKLLPSVVYYSDDPSCAGVVVGAQARREGAQHPQDVIASVKRFMGKGPKDVETKKLGTYRFAESTSTSTSSEHGGVVRFIAGGREVTPVEVSSEVLKKLKLRAEAFFGEQVDRAVITVPAYFDDAQRQATKDAGRLAGLEVLRLLNEPTAAALAYGLDKGSQGIFAVYDLGGGTFDISILQLVEGVFQVKSTGGDSALGGDDFDRAIASAMLAKAGLDTSDAGRVHAALAEARRVKEALTTAERETFKLGAFSYQLSRDEMDALIKTLVQKTGGPCRRALKDAGFTPDQLDGVILVGGSTRVLAVRSFVREMFGKEPLGDIDPDEVVALGAAVQADLLSNHARRDEVLLLDVNPLSLGIETMGGVVSKLIARNSSIPASAKMTVTTFQDGQTGMDIHVLQGERELVQDCRSLARFKLSGIPPMAAGLGRVDITFAIDADGILSVSAKEQTTGAQQSITVKPSHGLTEEEMEQMLLDSLEHAEEDVSARLLREERVEVQRIGYDARKQLDRNGALLNAEERARVEAALAQLEQSAKGDDHRAIAEQRAHFEDTVKPFAEKIMNAAIAQAVKGHVVSEFEEARK
jgi:molecular chaperone HscA